MPSRLDGGWGWMVVFSSFLLHVIIDGISYAFGVLAADLVGELGSSRQLNGWIASTMVGVTLAGGPVASAGCARFGHRAVATAGSVIAGVGFAVSYFVNSAAALIGTIGFVVGFGMSLIYLPAIICVGIYFERLRSTAIGIAVCGSGVGTLAFSPLISVLLHEYTWRGTMLILSAAALQCAVFSALLRPLDDLPPESSSPSATPPPPPPQPPPPEVEDGAACLRAAEDSDLGQRLLLLSSPSLDVASVTLDDAAVAAAVAAADADNGDAAPAAATANFLSVQDVRRVRLAPDPLLLTGARQRRHHLAASSLANVSRPAHFVRSITSIASAAAVDRHAWLAPSPPLMKMASREPPKEPAQAQAQKPKLLDAIRLELRGLLHAELLANPAFLLFLLSNLLCSVGFNAPYIYTPDRALTAGHGDTDSALLVSVIGASNMAGRLLFGWLSDRGFVSRLWIYCGSLSVSGLALIASCVSDGYAFSAVCCAAFGVFSGPFVTLTSPVLVDLLGIDKLSDSFGLTLLFQGVGVLGGPPLAGLLYDWTASFDVPFLVCGASLVASGLLMVPVHWLHDRDRVTQEL